MLRLRVVSRAKSSWGRYRMENPTKTAFAVVIFSVSSN